MRVLVVGGTGFIGERLCQELHDGGNEVTAMARDPDEADLPDGVERVAGDVTEYDAIVDAFDGQAVVVNLVSLSPLFRPVGGDERHFTVHRDGTENVVRAAEDRGVRKLVQVSGLGADPDGETAFIRAKGDAEQIVRASGLEWTIVRPSVVFGDGGEFVPAMKSLAPPHLTPLPGGGKTRFQPIWVGDLVPMLADAVEGRAGRCDVDGTTGDGTDTEGGTDTGGGRDPADDERDVEDETDDDETDDDETDDDEPDPPADPHAGQTYDIGGPEVLTLAEVAELAHAAQGKPVRVVPVPMFLAGLGLRALDLVPATVLDSIPGIPRMGSDQYRSLRFDNTTEDNDVDAFGVATEDMMRLSEYLGVRRVEVDVEAETGD